MFTSPVEKSTGNWRTANWRTAARVFYISLVFSNARRVLSQCIARFGLLYLLNKTWVFDQSERALGPIYIIILVCSLVNVCLRHRWKNPPVIGALQAGKVLIRFCSNNKVTFTRENKCAEVYG